VYQGTAVVHTVVPTTYAQLCRMYLRWERSYVREELRFLSIVWRRPLVPMLIAIVEKSATNLRYPVAYLSLGLMVTLSIEDPATFLRLMFAIGAMSAFHMFYYLRVERSWNFVFGILYAYFAVFAMWWIFPFALLTVRARGWLTR
jgi:hyaluronan synthase